MKYPIKQCQINQNNNNNNNYNNTNNTNNNHVPISPPIRDYPKLAIAAVSFQTAESKQNLGSDARRIKQQWTCFRNP